MNTGDLVMYLKRESSVEETSLLVTKQDKCQGKNRASQNKAEEQEDTVGRNEVG